MAHSWQLAIRIRCLGTLPSVTHRVAGQPYGNWRDLKEVIEYEIARAYGQHDDTEVGGWFREAEICTRPGGLRRHSDRQSPANGARIARRHAAEETGDQRGGERGPDAHGPDPARRRAILVSGPDDPGPFGRERLPAPHLPCPQGHRAPAQPH